MESGYDDMGAASTRPGLEVEVEDTLTHEFSPEESYRKIELEMAGVFDV